MTVREYCLNKTKAETLVKIKDGGWAVCVAWIDYEDLFAIHPKYANKRVLSADWGTLRIYDPANGYIEVPALEIDT